MKTIKYFSILFIIVFLYIGFNMLYTIYHEQGHKAIYKKYGLNSTIQYNFNPFSDEPAGLTLTYDPEHKCDIACKIGNVNMEVQSVAISFILSALFIVAMTILIYTHVLEELCNSQGKSKMLRRPA